MKLVSLLVLALPLFLASACRSSSPGNAGEIGNATEAKADKKEDKKAEAKARKEAKRAHELTCAKGDLQVAELETTAATREASDALDDAQRELDEAQRALEHFKTRELKHELADGRLGLDRAIQRKEEAALELREMEATFKKDEFALDTKELVLARHRKQLEFATRDLELEEQQYGDMEREKLPRQMREHEQKLREAERAVREAEAELKKIELENAVKLAKARFEVTELERPLDDDEDEDEGSDKGRGGKS